MTALSDSERGELIEQLARTRVGFGRIDGVEGHRRSPSCGDEVTVRVALRGDAIEGLGWEGHGCVVSTAAASALASLAPGLSVPEFRELAERYLASLTPDGLPLADELDIGDLDVFAGIGRFPLRAGCASLSWRATLDALG